VDLPFERPLQGRWYPRDDFVQVCLQVPASLTLHQHLLSLQVIQQTDNKERIPFGPAVNGTRERRE